MIKYNYYKNKYMIRKNLIGSSLEANKRTFLNIELRDEIDYNPLISKIKKFTSILNKPNEISDITENPRIILYILYIYIIESEPNPKYTNLITHIIKPSFDINFSTNINGETIYFFEYLLKLDIYDIINKFDFNKLTSYNKSKFYNMIFFEENIDILRKMLEYNKFPNNNDMLLNIFKSHFDNNKFNHILYKNNEIFKIFIDKIVTNENLKIYLYINKFLTSSYEESLELIDLIDINKINKKQILNILFVKILDNYYKLALLIGKGFIIKNDDDLLNDIINKYFTSNHEESLKYLELIVLAEIDLTNNSKQILNILFDKILDNYDKLSSLIEIGLIINNDDILDNLITKIKYYKFNPLYKTEIEFIITNLGIEYFNIPNIIYDNSNIIGKIFSYKEYTTEDIFWHGSYNKVNDCKLKTPTFYSTDFLQSLGHLLVHTQTYSLNKPKTSLKSIIEFIPQVLEYYPLIYKYQPIQNINVLILDKTWDDDFRYIFRPEMLYNYLIKDENIVEIILNFCNYKTINQIKNILELYEIINFLLELKKNMQEIDKIDLIIKSIIKKNLFNVLLEYSNECTRRCFRSFMNIPGYYLLQIIDYNNYFKDIKIIESDVIIEGFYIPNDQDEIILFNNCNLTYKEIIYIVPFFLINICEVERESRIKEYINRYIELATDLKSQIQCSELYTNFYEHYIKLGKKGDIEDNTDLTLENSWYFDYFKSYCTEFDAYTHITDNCPINRDGKYEEKYEICKIKQYSDKNFYDYYVKPKRSRFDHSSNLSQCGKIKNSKQTIYNIDDIEKLNIYINFLQEEANNTKLQLFN